MREKYTVKLCLSCPYTQEDLADAGEDLYDPDAEEFCCGQCPESPVYKPPGVTYPRDGGRGK
jgi:hypothetical protein